ncbi:MAG: hypothetical protein HY211_03765 [Candidatus Omnitrophica bacterium]|nr:hypothetical protein [Candidatus Omnitrophota bacterium]
MLRRLRSRTGGLLEFRAPHARDAWVRLGLPDGPRVTVPMTLLTPARLARQSSTVTYLALLDVALRKEGGPSLHDLSLDALQARTGLSAKLLSRARRDLE